MAKWRIVYRHSRDAEYAFNILRRSYDLEKISEDTLIMVNKPKNELPVTSIKYKFEIYGDIDSIEPCILKKPIEYHTKDRSMYQQFYPSGLYSDKTIIINKISFPVHRIILSSISDFFAGLFSEYGSDVIELYDIDVDGFNLLMHFIYGYVLKPDGINTLKLLSLADKLLIRDLDPENIIMQLNISEPDFEEYLEILSLLYPDNVSDNIIYHIYRTLGKNYWNLAPQRWHEQIKKLVTADI